MLSSTVVAPINLRKQTTDQTSLGQQDLSQFHPEVEVLQIKEQIGCA